VHGRDNGCGGAAAPKAILGYKVCATGFCISHFAEAVGESRSVFVVVFRLWVGKLVEYYPCL